MRDAASTTKHPLQYRLQGFSPIKASDIQALTALLSDVNQHLAGSVIVPAGHPQTHAVVVASGWCARCHLDEHGKRQIINYLLPGEMAGVFLGVYPSAEYEITALTDVDAWRIPAQALADMFSQCPRVALALTWMAARDERLLEKQIVRLGLSESVERLADLLAELYTRQLAAGAQPEVAARLPIRQQDLADTLGLSRVHTNLICQALGETGAMASTHSGIVIQDIAKLQRIAAFDDSYLGGNRT